MQRERRRALTVALALLSVGAVTATVFLVAAGRDRGHAAAGGDSRRCSTGAFPGETETVAPTPSTAAAASLFPTSTPTATTVTGTPAAPSPPPILSGTVGTTLWTGAWSTSLQDLSGRAQWAEAGSLDVPTDLAGRTVRQIVHPTIGGTSFRIRLGNPFGTETLRLAKVTAAVAVATGRPALRAGTVHRVTFGGAGQVEIPPGEQVLSDPVDQAFEFGRSLAVDLVPAGPAPADSGHSRSASTSYLAPGDRAGALDGSGFGNPVRSWFWLESLEVPDRTVPAADAISMFGDSITEGLWSTPDTDRRWPDRLAQRLRAEPATAGMGVLNEGIGGNRVVSENLSCLSPSASGLRRFAYDVLDRTDVRVVVIALGINDIGFGTPAATVIDGLKTLTARAHERGLRVVGATLTPYTCAGGCLTPEKNQQRQLVNDWIRTAPDFDAVVDFDAAVRDPGDPERMLPLYDSGDHLHPGDAGMRSMAAAFDLHALTGR